jgi:ABC-2 type transport system permease protein
MRHALSIARRELRSYFISPIAYIVMTIFAFVSGFFYSTMLQSYIQQAADADRVIERLGHAPNQLDVPTMVLNQFFTNEAFIMVLVLPLLTMGLISEERRKGTLELLLTSPVRSEELVAGKFLGALALFAIMLLPTLPFHAFMAVGGDWEPGVVLTGYVGLLVKGAACIAIGLSISSLCESPLIAAFGTYGILLTLEFIGTSAVLARSVWVDFINFLSSDYHFGNFSRGVLALRDVVYFATLMTLALFLTQRSIESIRFKRS